MWEGLRPLTLSIHKTQIQPYHIKVIRHHPDNPCFILIEVDLCEDVQIEEPREEEKTDVGVSKVHRKVYWDYQSEFDRTAWQAGGDGQRAVESGGFVLWAEAISWLSSNQ